MKITCKDMIAMVGFLSFGAAVIFCFTAPRMWGTAPEPKAETPAVQEGKKIVGADFKAHPPVDIAPPKKNSK